ncbi:tRNA wybutosine-synthesizing protein 5 [Hydra vulgaris]|uniref:tRNA wybutosine-synthesizing protein 5 n=1 Tax=Hydra vulgaris TaxID=6087 RepID=A0ABM4DF76_HYDVU
MSKFKVDITYANKIDNFEDFFKTNIYTQRKPVVIKGLNVGVATEKWDVSYLSENVKKAPVQIHVCPVPEMDFINKNFLYKTINFDDFLAKAENKVQSNFFICSEEKYYLRSLGEDIRNDAADIRKQFPKLSQDLIIPNLFDESSFFSSIFRISSSGLKLWTHYDVMDNILLQIKGTKKVVFFSPKDALNLYLNGDKSEIIDIKNTDYEKYPKFKCVNRYSCKIYPGDVLFIPALWFHNVTAIDFSISVNVFWKHLNDKMYNKKDIYGNKDLVPAEKAMQSFDKIIKLLEELPIDYKDFYMKRLILKADKAINKWRLDEQVKLNKV